MKAIELAVYHLNAEIPDESFSAIVTASDEWLLKQPGFIVRRHGVRENGEHVDYAEWETMAHALSAAEKFEADPDMRPFMDAIDMKTLSMRHFEMVS